MRKIDMITNFQESADGSVLISFGRTRVLCAASISQGVLPFLRGKGEGWLTAEYGMLPGSTGERKSRPGAKPDGRSVEIQRLIGRSLRAALDFRALGEHTITIDCDVIQADGGTRTASITGGFVALTLAIAKWVREGKLPHSPIRQAVAAVSVGLVEDEAILDLDYDHDHRAQADMNVVMLSDGGLIEVQGTGEKRAFSREELSALLDLAQGGCEQLFAHQRAALGEDARFVQCFDEPLVIATQNQGKLKELRVMLGKRFSNVCTLADRGIEEQAEENADTFEGNAILKAEHAARLTGCAALADDSGLEVDALGGEPGVYSARYAGEHASDEENLALLLKNLQDKPQPWTARFVACAALARPGKETIVVRGAVEGHMIASPRGEGGFGYDPAFVAEGDELTFSEITPAQKNAKSHRHIAIERLLAELEKEDEK